jgi:hypothetical protein
MSKIDDAVRRHTARAQARFGAPRTAAEWEMRSHLIASCVAMMLSTSAPGSNAEWDLRWCAAEQWEATRLR